MVGGAGRSGFLVYRKTCLYITSRLVRRVNFSVFLPVASITSLDCVSFQYPTV